MIQIALPRLNRLVPSIESTFHKLVEEHGELSETIIDWSILQGSEKAREALHLVAGELLDVAQTCISLAFVLEDIEPNVNLSDLLSQHLSKLTRKGYLHHEEKVEFKTTEEGYRLMSLPRLSIPNVSLESTVLNISVALGRFAQFIGKFNGASGEARTKTPEEMTTGCGLNILHIAQCCFTMLYILEHTFLMDIQKLVKEHVAKLKVRGYID
jgi:hypothetical protein